MAPPAQGAAARAATTTTEVMAASHTGQTNQGGTSAMADSPGLSSRRSGPVSRRARCAYPATVENTAGSAMSRAATGTASHHARVQASQGPETYAITSARKRSVAERDVSNG